jgi:hypothetical protein
MTKTQTEKITTNGTHFLFSTPEKCTAVNQVICCSKGKKEMFGMSQTQKE